MMYITYHLSPSHWPHCITGAYILTFYPVTVETLERHHLTVTAHNCKWAPHEYVPKQWPCSGFSLHLLLPLPLLPQTKCSSIICKSSAWSQTGSACAPRDAFLLVTTWTCPSLSTLSLYPAGWLLERNVSILHSWVHTVGSKYKVTLL